MSTQRATSTPLTRDFATEHQPRAERHAARALSAEEPLKEAVQRIRGASSISISPDLFEKMYLSPRNSSDGDLRRRFGNPTPLALAGFLLALTPLSCEMMGWRGGAVGPITTMTGSASSAVYFFMGGLLMFVSGILEFFLGNTFPFVVFASYGGYWFALGATFSPIFNAYGAYSSDPVQHPELGVISEGFNSSMSFFLLFMAILSLVFLICSLRTNIFFATIFFTLFLGFILETVEFFVLSRGEFIGASSARTAAGISYFLSVVAGWYIFLAQMLLALDFPVQLPIGDLSLLIRGRSEKLLEKASNSV
ncbi:MAG: hypothetical protein M1829_005601 [Trizodia sp. TS-e1964]|nr:MAG: hypothetical protein M1829_005601 [Trizodia sp. TS-e1964]